uniref:Uncharacterized protein n=1 Tax=Magallana gigas TaxID=29159 RepID=K1QVG8_MAGGI
MYRLPSDALELAKVSRLLHCINNGTISKFKGLDFDEIEFDKEYEYYISRKWLKKKMMRWMKTMKMMLSKCGINQDMTIVIMKMEVKHDHRKHHDMYGQEKKKLP